MPICCAQGIQVTLRINTRGRCGIDIWQIETARQQIEKDTGEATIEIGKRVDAEQATLGEGQRLQPKIVWFGRQSCQTRVQIGDIALHVLLKLEGRWRFVAANDDLVATPTTRKLRSQVTTNVLVEVAQQGFIDGALVKFTIRDGVLHRFDTARQMRRERGIAQDAERGVEVARCCVRRSSSSSNIF